MVRKVMLWMPANWRHLLRQLPTGWHASWVKTSWNFWEFLWRSWGIRSWPLLPKRAYAGNSECRLRGRHLLFGSLWVDDIWNGFFADVRKRVCAKFCIVATHTLNTVLFDCVRDGRNGTCFPPRDSAKTYLACWMRDAIHCTAGEKVVKTCGDCNFEIAKQERFFGNHRIVRYDGQLVAEFLPT